MLPLYYEQLLRELTGINLHDIQGKLTYSQINTMLGASVSGGSLDRLAEKLGDGKLLINHKGKKLKKGFNGLINYLVMTNARLYRSREKFLIDDLHPLYQHKREVVGMLMCVVKELKASPDYANERWMQALFVQERGNNIIVGFREGQRERVIVKSSFGNQKNLREFLRLYDSSGKNGQYPGGVQRKRGLSRYAQEVHEYYTYLKNRKQKRYDFLS